MALFNYNKPGPGISKNNGYEVNRFALYFQLLGRKFWNICVLNLVLVLFTVPYLGFSILLYKLLANIAFFATALGFQFRVIVALAPFMLYGPVLTATFKIARDFAREEPVFLFSDFWETFKNNLFQPIILSALSYFFFSALSFALPAYFSATGISTYVFFPLCLLALFMLICMQFYIYTMAACFDLSLKDILKNGLIFSFMCFGGNLIVLFVLFVLLGVCLFMLLMAFEYPILFGLLFILLLCLIPAFFIYTAAFVTHPALQKYVVEPFYQANPDKTSAVLKSPPAPLENDEQQPIQKEIPEYVYHNGRMVHRSVLESESLFDDERKIGPDNNQ